MRKTIRKLFLLLFSISLLIGLFTVAAGAVNGAPVLFDKENGTALAILLPEAPSESEKAAAQTLQTYLEQVTGEKPEIITVIAGEDAGGIISLAQVERLSDRPKGSYELRLGADETQTPTDDPVFYIEASDSRGLFNGVYGFLRRICGVEIYSANVKKVPAAETIAPEVPYYFSYTPTLEYADTDWISPHDLEFALANGLNGMYSPIETVHGGKVNYLWFAHSMTNSLVPESQFFESHPEYYALQEDGTRQPTQLCLSNPDVIAQAKKDVRARLKDAYDPDAALNIISITQDDNQKYCTCENCTALADRYGAQSGPMLWFVNQIAEDVEPDYPDLVVDTFAYHYTRQPPVAITARDNVCVRLCSIECCFSHTINDPACDINVKFMNDLEGWGKCCKRLYVWDYVTDFIQTLCVFPNFNVLRSNLETFRSHNVVGIYEEGAYFADPAGVEFYDLRAYLLSVLMRDEMTAQEEQAARQGFLEAYYGGQQSAAAVDEIIDILCAHAGNEQGHLFVFSAAKYIMFGFTEDEIHRVNELWQIALTAAKENGDSDAVTRIENARLAWRYYEASIRKGEFKENLPGIANVGEMRKLIGDLKAAGVTRYNEGLTLDQMHPSVFISPGDWDMRDNAVVLPAVICGAVAVLLGLAAAVVALVKKHRLCALLLLALSVAAVPLGASASELFIQWDNLPVYAVVDALMLLCVAGFCLTAAWAINGCRFPKGIKAVLTVLLCLFIAAAPYEIVVLIVNTLIYHGQKPMFSITLSAFVQIAIVAAGCILIIANLIRRKKNAGDTE